MHKLPSLLALAATLTSAAWTQEIVIEPTNGRPQTANRVSRPAAVDSTPAEPARSSAKPTAGISAQQHRKPAAKAPAKRLASNEKPATVETKPTAPAMAEPVESTPAPKKIPERPTWAASDARDGSALQAEIASALARDPKLSGSAIEVSVDGASVLLKGHAAGSEERLQAQRLAMSYAWNRRVVDQIAVTPSISAQK